VNGEASLAKIEMLERSLQCFVCGLIGLLQVIGFPASLLALINYRRVCVGQRGIWNAARNYLIWGFIFAAVGMVISLVVFGAILFAALTDNLF
jgi:hypothetical protein